MKKKKKLEDDDESSMDKLIKNTMKNMKQNICNLDKKQMSPAILFTRTIKKHVLMFWKSKKSNKNKTKRLKKKTDKDDTEEEEAEEEEEEEMCQHMGLSHPEGQLFCFGSDMQVR